MKTEVKTFYSALSLVAGRCSQLEITKNPEPLSENNSGLFKGICNAG